MKVGLDKLSFKSLVRIHDVHDRLKKISQGSETMMFIILKRIKRTVQLTRMSE